MLIQKNDIHEGKLALINQNRIFQLSNNSNKSSQKPLRRIIIQTHLYQLGDQYLGNQMIYDQLVLYNYPNKLVKSQTPDCLPENRMGLSILQLCLGKCQLTQFQKESKFLALMIPQQLHQLQNQTNLQLILFKFELINSTFIIEIGCWRLADNINLDSIHSQFSIKYDAQPKQLIQLKRYNFLQVETINDFIGLVHACCDRSESPLQLHSENSSAQLG